METASVFRLEDPEPLERWWKVAVRHDTASHCLGLSPGVETTHINSQDLISTSLGAS